MNLEEEDVENVLKDLAENFSFSTGEQDYIYTEGDDDADMDDIQVVESDGDIIESFNDIEDGFQNTALPNT